MLPLELGSDLLQVHLTAGDYDPGHHLLLRTFALRTQQQSVSAVNAGVDQLSLPWLPAAYLHGFTESVGKVELSVLEAVHCGETFEDEPFSPSSGRKGNFLLRYPE